MIKLKSPLLWDGHLIPTGKSVALPKGLEKNIVAAGNGEYVIPETETDPKNTEPPVTAEMLDLAKRVEALKLDLPDDSTVEQVREAVEKAEQEQDDKLTDGQSSSDGVVDSDGTEQKNSQSGEQIGDDPELSLGRVGRTQ